MLWRAGRNCPRTRRRRAACSPRVGRHDRFTTTTLESARRCWPRARSWIRRSTATWSGRPVSQAVSAALQEMLGVDLKTAPRGIDGCGLTTYEPRCQPSPAVLLRPAPTPHSGAPRTRWQRPVPRRRHESIRHRAARGCGRAARRRIGGAEVWAAVARPDGPGIAIKVEAGGGEAIPVIALAVLQQLGLLDADLPDRLRPFASVTVRNWAGRDVGEIRPAAAGF